MAGGHGVSTGREYPEHPRVGVGAVVLHGDHVLLVQRGGQPSAGKWSLPGGSVELGETTVEAVRREVQEECGIEIDVAGVAGVVDRVVRDDEGRIRYHWVLVDFLAFPGSEAIAAGTDAADARWVEIARVNDFDVTDGLLDIIERAIALARGART
jgi:ADP-ribose pyrophosphatase YjhB (NUDIX family)